MAAIGRIIVDAGPLVGFLDKRDQWHDWATGRFAELPGPFLTCEAVLSEACYLLGKHADRLLEMVDLGGLEISPVFREHATRVRDLMRSYSPRMALADACLVRLSELNSDARVLTTDGADFRLYRRNRREEIPLIAP